MRKSYTDKIDRKSKRQKKQTDSKGARHALQNDNAAKTNHQKKEIDMGMDSKKKENR